VDGLIAINRHEVEFLDLDALALLGHFQPLTLTRIPLAANLTRVS
jgi:hypothetical protein